MLFKPLIPRRWFPFLLLLVFALTACVHAPQQMESEPVPVHIPQWPQAVGGTALLALVETALLENPGLQATLARVEATRATARIRGADRLPQVSAGLSASRSETGTGDFSTTRNSFELSTDISWEADIWQRIAARHRAAIADAKASEADYQAARLMLAGEVSRQWLNAIETGLQAQLAAQRVASFEKTANSIADRYRAGIAEALDLRLARENLATARSALASRQRNADQALRGLETVLGRYPDAKQPIDTALPELNQAIPAGLPSTLLSRRPDILAAEQRLAASAARQEDAARNWLPALRLTGSGGTLSDEFSNLLNWDYLVWRIATGLTQPLFNGGRLSAERVLARANNRESLANYSQTVLTAFREVETALAAEPLLKTQLEAQQQAADQAQAAAELAASRYNNGLTDIITLLDTQRRAFNTQSNLLTTKLSQLLNRIDLHLALGGDFAPKEATKNQ